MKTRRTSEPKEPPQPPRRPEAAGGMKAAKPTPLQAAGEVVGLSDSEFRSRVAQKAFELYQRRGGHPGHEVDDWLEAERLVREEMRGNGDRDRR